MCRLAASTGRGGRRHRGAGNGLPLVWADGIRRVRAGAEPQRSCRSRGRESRGRAQLRQHPRHQADDRVTLLRLQPGSRPPSGQHQARLLDHQAGLDAARLGDPERARPPRQSRRRSGGGFWRSPPASFRRPGLRPPAGQVEALLAVPALRLAAGKEGRLNVPTH